MEAPSLSPIPPDSAPIRDPKRLNGVILTKGAHKNLGAGLCVMEAAALFAGCPHGDSIPCACPDIQRFARRINDANWPSDEERTKAMLPIVFLIVGTVGRTDRQRNAFRFADAAVRSFAPQAFEARAEVATEERAKILRHHAAAMRAAQPIVDKATAEAGRALARAAAAYAYAAAAAADAAAARSPARIRILTEACELLASMCREAQEMVPA